MCDKCDEQIAFQEALLERELSDREMAIIGIGLMVGLIRLYVVNDYCDPAMYEALEKVEKLAKQIDEEMYESVAFMKIQAGEIVARKASEGDYAVEGEDFPCEHEM